MKPAFSVIFFTSISGAGYGLLLFLSVGILGDAPNLYSDKALSLPHVLAWGTGFGLVIVSLLSSLFHLGHPERFLRALTQWRTSWLSREGVWSLVSFVPLGLAAFLEIYFGITAPMLTILCIFVVFMTVYSTSMIYGSIKAIPYWASPLTPAVYISFGASSGWLLTVFFKVMLDTYVVGDFILAAILAVLSFGIMIVWWVQNDRAEPVANVGSATGLGDMGRVSELARPHMNENYLLKEMGFVIGRKHGAALRKISVGLGLIVVLILLGGAVLAGSNVVLVTGIVALAALVHLAGIFVSRWLFFAQAKHTVMLYYGQDEV